MAVLTLKEVWANLYLRLIFQPLERKVFDMNLKAAHSEI